MAEWIGAFGVSLLLIAFFLNLFGRLRNGAWIYLALNALGAGLACYSAYLIQFMPFVILEGTWCLVALISLLHRVLGAAVRRFG